MASIQWKAGGGILWKTGAQIAFDPACCCGSGTCQYDFRVEETVAHAAPSQISNHGQSLVSGDTSVGGTYGNGDILDVNGTPGNYTYIIYGSRTGSSVITIDNANPGSQGISIHVDAIAGDICVNGVHVNEGFNFTDTSTASSYTLTITCGPCP